MAVIWRGNRLTHMMKTIIITAAFYMLRNTVTCYANREINHY